MAQKKHNGWERKRVRLIQNKLLKRASRKASEQASGALSKGEAETAAKAETPPQ